MGLPGAINRLIIIIILLREKWREGGNNVLINLVKHVGKAEIKSIAG